MQPWQNMLCANDNLGWVACNHARSAGHTKLESFANPSVGHTDLDCRPIWTMLAQGFAPALEHFPCRQVSAVCVRTNNVGTACKGPVPYAAHMLLVQSSA